MIRDDLFSILESNNQFPSICYWNSILNFYRINKKSLNLEELIVLANESERCREFQNKEKEKEKEIKRNDGSIEIIITQIQGLNIKKSDVYPDIHSQIARLEYSKHTEENIKNNSSNQKTVAAV